MKKYLYSLLAIAVLLVMTGFTNSTANARVENADDSYSFLVQQPQVVDVEIQLSTIQNYNYQPSETFVIINNEEFCQVPGGVQAQPNYFTIVNNDVVELVHNYIPRNECSKVAVRYKYLHKVGI